MIIHPQEEKEIYIQQTRICRLNRDMNHVLYVYVYVYVYVYFIAVQPISSLIFAYSIF